MDNSPIYIRPASPIPQKMERNIPPFRIWVYLHRLLIPKKEREYLIKYGIFLGPKLYNTNYLNIFYMINININMNDSWINDLSIILRKSLIKDNLNHDINNNETNKLIDELTSGINNRRIVDIMNTIKNIELCKLMKTDFGKNNE